MNWPHPGEDPAFRREADGDHRPAARVTRPAPARESGMFRLVSAVLMIVLVAPLVGLVAEATTAGSDFAGGAQSLAVSPAPKASVAGSPALRARP